MPYCQATSTQLFNCGFGNRPVAIHYNLLNYLNPLQILADISEHIYSSRLPDAPVSSLIYTVVLFPTLLLTVTSVRRHCSFLLLETSSKTILALQVCLTLVKCSSNIYSIIFMQGKGIVFLLHCMHVFTCFSTTTSFTL